jgi:hypothetical protein
MPGGRCLGLQLPPFIGIIEHLGYPAYLMTILGVWYFLAGVALLAPRFPNAGCFRSLLLVICPYLGASVINCWSDPCEDLRHHRL